MTGYFILLFYPSPLYGSKGRYSLLVDAQKSSLAGKSIVSKEEKSSAKVKELEKPLKNVSLQTLTIPMAHILPKTNKSLILFIIKFMSAFRFKIVQDKYL